MNGSDVIAKNAGRSKLVGTQRTSVFLFFFSWLFVPHLYVLVEHMFYGIRFTTNGTRKVFTFFVYTKNVISEICSDFERFPTRVALIRSIARVRDHMLLQAAGMIEGFVTFRTFGVKLFQVNGARVLRVEIHAADVARVASFILVTLVNASYFHPVEVYHVFLLRFVSLKSLAAYFTEKCRDVIVDYVYVSPQRARRIQDGTADFASAVGDALMFLPLNSRLKCQSTNLTSQIFPPEPFRVQRSQRPFALDRT